MMTTTLSAPPTTLRSAPGRRAALGDVAVYVLASLGAVAAEETLRRAGLFPLPHVFDGAPSLIAGFFVVWALVHRRGQSLSDLGLRRPSRLWTIPAWAVAILVVHVITQIVVAPALGRLLGAPEPDLSRYDVLRGNLPLFLVTAPGAMLTGGFMEEVIYRGFMVDRLARILGARRGALVAAALLCGLPFGIIHFAWGFGGIVVATVMGSTLGLMFLATRRNLWPLIAAHATLDLLLLLQVYLQSPA
jgi:membrane protease YdiL (CAAX protease family)